MRPRRIGRMRPIPVARMRATDFTNGPQLAAS
jgi:hypothetical protein